MIYNICVDEDTEVILQRDKGTIYLNFHTFFTASQWKIHQTVRLKWNASFQLASAIERRFSSRTDQFSLLIVKLFRLIFSHR